MTSRAARIEGRILRRAAARLCRVAGGAAACLAVAGGSPWGSTWGSSADAAEFLATSATQITAALAQAGPGDVIVMANGVWTNQSINFNDNGAAGNPITLRAQTPGQVILNGTSKLSINGNWLVVDGLKFQGGALTGGSIINLSGNNLRLTNTAIIDYNPPSIETEVDWVTVNGQDNRVDHNYFKNHNSVGQTLEVRHTAGVPNRARIDGNYFADRPTGNGNGWETIRIGLSGVATSNSFSIVENNLFERVDGENEAISNKSSNNIYRYNTFRDMRATLTLRHGNDATVEGNFFLGENQDGSGGVRVIGQRHKIINNYFNGVDDNGGGAIAINRGEVDAAATGYQPVKDLVIAHNTIVNTLGSMLRFDAGASTRPLLAENVTVANNVFRSNGPAIFTGTEGPGWTWQGNYAFGGSLGPKAGAAGIANVNPQLQLGADGLWRPAANSPLINAAVGPTSALAPNDMDGQPRIGIADVGADEVSTASIVRRPLVADDVGPSWLFNRPAPTTPGFGPAGVAIQAEDFKAILDPNGNGRVWSVAESRDAINGRLLAAPAGNRVDLPGMAHDSLAVYDMRFQTPGVYTAYYRSRGLNAATNSIYAPSGFNANPSNPLDLSDNGVFTWVKDARTFEITAANVDVPLEFRLGMREELAQLDAIVLSLNANMTADELDGIFPIAPADLDWDGALTANDWRLFKAGQGAPLAGLTNLQQYLLGDVNRDGRHSIDDFAAFRQAYDAAHGPGAFAAMAAGVPEPTAACLALLAAAMCGRRRGRG